MRNTLIDALCGCAERGVRARARRFLAGLSSDELEFLSAILGACILESSEDLAQAAEAVQMSHCRSLQGGVRGIDQEQKLILLREFLRRSRRTFADDAGPAAA